MPETIYFDTCAINRLTDSAVSTRVRLETEAVVQLLDGVAAGRVRWIASTALRLELVRNTDVVRRRDALSVLGSSHALVSPSPEALLRAHHLRLQGLGAMDGLHLALAEHEKVDWLVTTDDRFLRRGSSLTLDPTQLINPVDLVRRRFPWLLPKP